LNFLPSQIFSYFSSLPIYFSCAEICFQQFLKMEKPLTTGPLVSDAAPWLALRGGAARGRFCRAYKRRRPTALVLTRRADGLSESATLSFPGKPQSPAVAPHHAGLLSPFLFPRAGHRSPALESPPGPRAVLAGSPSSALPGEHAPRPSPACRVRPAVLTPFCHRPRSPRSPTGALAEGCHRRARGQAAPLAVSSPPEAAARPSSKPPCPSTPCAGEAHRSSLLRRAAAPMWPPPERLHFRCPSAVGQRGQLTLRALCASRASVRPRACARRWAGGRRPRCCASRPLRACSNWAAAGDSARCL
jgi:hypothetical protein